MLPAIIKTYGYTSVCHSVLRNKRTAQAERLSAITVALQYDSDEEGILSGTSSSVQVDWWDVHPHHSVLPVRFGALRRRRVRGGEPDLQHGHEQPHLSAVRGGARRQEQPGPAHLGALPAAAIQKGLPRLLPADHSAHLPAAHQVRVDHSAGNARIMKPIRDQVSYSACLLVL